MLFGNRLFIWIEPSSGKSNHALPPETAPSMTELLIDIPENPQPEQAISGFFKARDGKQIRYARFGVNGRPVKGTVIVLPGRNECIEKYFETIGDLQTRGFTVATFDWRGQGGSDRLIGDPMRGHVDSFDSYVRDLEQFFDEIVLPDCRSPFYLLAHSTGALVALLAAPAMVNRVRRMVLIAPFLELKKTSLSMKSVRRLSGFLNWTGLGQLYIGGGPQTRDPAPFAGNVLTTDRRRYARNTDIYRKFPELGLGGPTAAWIHAASVAAERVRDPEFMAKIRIPSLFIAAGADDVVSTRAIEDYASRLRSGTVLTIDGARHEILQEADIFREQALAAFDAFVPGTDSGV
ncbi:lysophospholipase [Mesorhizobium albiziae]|uniref:Lysophospholipase n=2 Tax=Neomesorhizobium albiziae TaxID=335020 RepID=A0A1I4A6D3_9HYPH|nr:lysophospholipase [Mesorhizobium albiziae]SFK51972.1 lysophospholipase [Mesorhizobium albiziae]